MDIFITDSNAIKALELIEVGGTKNIAKKFIKKHAIKLFGKEKTAANNAFALFEGGDTSQASFDEWAAILKSKQAAMLARHDYLSTVNKFDYLVKKELKDSYKHQTRKRCYDKKFALKDAIDAELFIFNRLAYGTVSVKDPLNQDAHPKKGISKTLNIKQWRYRKNSNHESWLIQIECGFTMTMPNPKDSFDFTVGLEVEFIKEGDDKIERNDDMVWLDMFNMNGGQENFVTNTLINAIHRQFFSLGIDSGVSAEEIGIASWYQLEDQA